MIGTSSGNGPRADKVPSYLRCLPKYPKSAWDMYYVSSGSPSPAVLYPAASTSGRVKPRPTPCPRGSGHTDVKTDPSSKSTASRRLPRRELTHIHLAHGDSSLIPGKQRSHHIRHASHDSSSPGANSARHETPTSQHRNPKPPVHPRHFRAKRWTAEHWLSECSHCREEPRWSGSRLCCGRKHTGRRR